MDLNNFCAVCGQESTQRCAKCKTVAYCSREHQAQDWNSHKKQCKILYKLLQIRDVVIANSNNKELLPQISQSPIQSTKEIDKNSEKDIKPSKTSDSSVKSTKKVENIPKNEIKQTVPQQQKDQTAKELEEKPDKELPMTGIPNHYKYEYLGDGKFAELNNEGKRPDRNGAVGQPANSKLTANQKKRLRKKNKKKSEKSTKGKELNEEDDDDEEESEENEDKKPTAKSKQPASKSKILDDIDDNFSLLLTSMDDIKVDKGWVFTNISLKNASTIQIDPPVSKGIVKCEFLNIKDLKTVGISEDQIYYGRNQWPVDTYMGDVVCYNFVGFIQHTDSDWIQGNAKFKTGDRIAMELNMDSKPNSLTFFINDMEQPNYVISISPSVRFWAFLQTKGDSYQISKLKRLSAPTAKHGRGSRSFVFGQKWKN